jgi:signal transduction protein with GAF and PtsI domain
MYRSKSLVEAFEVIVEEITKCLNCDNARVFIIDNEKGDLWTKVNNGKIEIRIQMGEGIEGYVAQKEESVNVVDAYQDDRFSKDVDL